MKSFAVLVFTVASLVTANATITNAAQTPLPPVLGRLLGDWSGAGVVTGRASQMTMTWSRDVGDAFVHLRFRNVMAEGGGRPAQTLDAHGYYRAASAAAVEGTGTWIDSRGVIFPVSFTVTGDAVTSDWGSPTTERGRTIYTLTGDGTLDVIDQVRAADGTYRQFGKSTLTRR